MNDLELLENSEYLFELALCKINNFEDAQDLVQETLIAGMNAVKAGIDVQNSKAFLSGILNHKFTDILRRKYSRPTIFYGVLPELEFQSDEKTPEQTLLNKDDEEKIHRCLAELSKIYREVMVLHFIHGKSVNQIAQELEINVNTVKSRLNSARKTVKQKMEKMEMEKFERQSYEPEKLNLWVFGELEEKNPFDVNDSKHLIHQNLMLLGYEKPLTVTEFSEKLGIAAAFIEPILNELVYDDFMIKTGDRYSTNFYIYSPLELEKIADNDKEVAKSVYKDMWQDIENYFTEIKSQKFFEEFTAKQKEIFLHFNAIFILQETEREIKARKIGKLDVMSVKHKSGWTGYAYGKHTFQNEKIDWTENGRMLFELNGAHGILVENYKDLQRLMFLAYEVNTGHTFGRFGIPDLDALKIFYALYSGEEKDIPLINQKFFEDEIINGLIEANILSKNEASELKLNIPVLELAAHEWWNSFLERTVPAFADKYESVLAPLFENGIKTPSHFKDVPKYMALQENGTHFPMAIVFYAHWNGLYLKDRDFQKNPIPAMLLMADK